MAGSLVSVAKGVLVALGEAHKNFVELRESLPTLGDTVLKVTQLALGREEMAISGPIQRSLTDRLHVIRMDLDKAQAELGTRKGQCCLFFLSLGGKGAKQYISNLREHEAALEQDLRLAELEVQQLHYKSARQAAETMDMMAGGAAARHIETLGAQQFWRLMFENEKSIDWDVFHERLITLFASDLYGLFGFGAKPAALITLLKSLLDTNSDGTVSVQEYSRFFVPVYLTKPKADNFDIFTMLEYHVTDYKGFSTGRLANAVIQGHAAPVTAIDVHENRLYTGDKHGTVKIWRIFRRKKPVTVKLMSVVAAHAKEVTVIKAVRFKHNGCNVQCILAGSVDGTVRLYHEANARCMAIYENWSSERVLCVSPCGNLMYTSQCFPCSSVTVWPLSYFEGFNHRVQPLLHLPGHSRSITCIIHINDFNLTLASSRDSSILVFSQQQKVRTFTQSVAPLSPIWFLSAIVSAEESSSAADRKCTIFSITANGRVSRWTIAAKVLEGQGDDYSLEGDFYTMCHLVCPPVSYEFADSSHVVAARRHSHHGFVINKYELPVAGEGRKTHTRKIPCQDLLTAGKEEIRLACTRELLVVTVGRTVLFFDFATFVLYSVLGGRISWLGHCPPFTRKDFSTTGRYSKSVDTVLWRKKYLLTVMHGSEVRMWDTARSSWRRVCCEQLSREDKRAAKVLGTLLHKYRLRLKGEDALSITEADEEAVNTAIKTAGVENDVAYLRSILQAWEVIDRTRGNRNLREMPVLSGEVTCLQLDSDFLWAGALDGHVVKYRLNYADEAAVGDATKYLKATYGIDIQTNQGQSRALDEAVKHIHTHTSDKKAKDVALSKLRLIQEHPGLVLQPVQSIRLKNTRAVRQCKECKEEAVPLSTYCDGCWKQFREKEEKRGEGFGYVCTVPECCNSRLPNYPVCDSCYDSRKEEASVSVLALALWKNKIFVGAVLRARLCTYGTDGWVEEIDAANYKSVAVMHGWSYGAGKGRLVVLSPQHKTPLDQGPPPALAMASGQGVLLCRIDGKAALNSPVCFVSHGEIVGAIAYEQSADGKWHLLTGGYDTVIKEWVIDCKCDTEWSCTVLRQFTGHREGVTALYPIPGRTTLLSGSVDGEIRLYDRKEGCTIRSLVAHGRSMRRFEQLYDYNGNLSNRIASVADDGTVSEWVIDEMEDSETIEYQSSSRPPTATLSWPAFDIISKDLIDRVFLRSGEGVVVVYPMLDRRAVKKAEIVLCVGCFAGNGIQIKIDRYRNYQVVSTEAHVVRDWFQHDNDDDMIELTTFPQNVGEVGGLLVNDAIRVDVTEALRDVRAAVALRFTITSGTLMLPVLPDLVLTTVLATSPNDEEEEVEPRAIPQGDVT
eukprot:Sspe_Gene.96551::Locus_69383_Transcript_4_4_Confidence_0.444_Length_4345::g.96551::m.96551